MSTTSNWTYKGKEVINYEDLPGAPLGFVYIIHNKTKDKYYVGKKQIITESKVRLTKKEKELPENRRKTFKYPRREMSGWKKYKGSNKILQEDIKKGDKYEKAIIALCWTKKGMTYKETETMFLNNVLEGKDFYNDNILGKFYRKDLESEKELSKS